MAEAYLLNNHRERGYIIRLPTLIGKGICNRFRNGEANAIGEIELMSIKDAIKKILEIAKSDLLIRNVRISGEKISANLVKRLILFGKNGK